MFSSFSKGFNSLSKTVGHYFKPTTKHIAPVSTPMHESMIDESSFLEGGYTVLNNDANPLKNPSSQASQEVFKQAALDAQMTGLAYEIGKNKAKVEAFKSTLEDKGVKYHKSTYDILGDNNSGKLQGAIFTNECSKTITLAIAGTRQNSISNFLTDFIDDALLSIGFNTYKTKSIAKINDHLLKEYHEQIQAGWKVHYTGHSLGGHSANVGANLLAAKGVVDLDKISTTTFDSAGGDTALKNATKLGGHARSIQEKHCLFTGANVTFDSRDNVINKADYKTETSVFKVHHSEHGPNALSKYNPVQLIKEHGLRNFLDALVDGKGCIVGENGAAVSYDPSHTTSPITMDHDTFRLLASSTTPQEDQDMTATMFDSTSNTNATIRFSTKDLQATQATKELLDHPDFGMDTSGFFSSDESFVLGEDGTIISTAA